MLVHNILEKSAIKHPDKTALVSGRKKMTYREINASADRLASELIKMGLKRQDRVIILAENSIETVISLFGILKAGGIFIIPSPTIQPKKLLFILKDTASKIIIAQKNKKRVIEAVVKDVTCLEKIIWIGKHHAPSLKKSIENYLFEDILSEKQSVLPLLNETIIDVDLAALIYTSGSTGDPKGIMEAHYNVIAAVKSITTYLENEENDIILNVLPLSFDYGLYQIFMSFYIGSTVILEKSFAYPYKILELLVQERVTGFPLVPTIVAILLQMENLSRFDFSSLRYVSNTAAALPVAYIKKIKEIFPETVLFSMYGLTECKRVAYLPPKFLETKPQSVGVPIPNEEVFILDKDGNIVGAEEIGELVVRGSNVMQGYWNAPEETKKRFKSGRYRGDALLYTGDLFKKDEDGFLYFVSRKDDLLKTKGELVSPKEIENILCEMEGIIEAAVIGIPDGILGQAIKAFIVVDKKRELNHKKVKRFCISNLEPFMVPKYIEFCDYLEKSNSGKIDKKKLK